MEQGHTADRKKEEQEGENYDSTDQASDEHRILC
jgi:hypothetical protein